MTRNKIASGLAKREKTKSQARIQAIRQMLKKLVEWEVDVLVNADDANFMNEDGPLGSLVNEAMKMADKKLRKKR